MQTTRNRPRNNQSFSRFEKKQRNIWPLSIEKILENHQLSHLQRIIRHTVRLLKVDEIVFQHLPKEVRKFCQVMQTDPSEIIIGVSSAAWLTRLRYWQPKLLSDLQTYPQLIHLTKIKFRIQAIQAQTQNTLKIPPKRRSLTLQNRELLEEIAKMVNDPQLALALKKLAAPK